MLIAGVDEAGRGPLIGSVVAAAVILNPNDPIEGLNDSKKLSEKKREKLFIEIQTKALCYSIAEASVEEIDQLNILHASMLAMHRAVDGLSVPVGKVLVDGNRTPNWNYVSEAIIGGDAIEPSISAASILAKVARDNAMYALDKEIPQYGLAKHKGYPTKMHMEMLREHGATKYHRKSFRPVARLLSF